MCTVKRLRNTITSGIMRTTILTLIMNGIKERSAAVFSRDTSSQNISRTVPEVPVLLLDLPQRMA